MNKSAPTAMAEAASPALEERIEESITKAVPVIVAKLFSSGGVIAPKEPSSKSGDSSSPGKPDRRRPRALRSGQTLLLIRGRF